MPSSRICSIPDPTLPRQSGRLHNCNRCWQLTIQIYFKNQTPAPGAEPFVPGRLPLSTVLGLVTDSFTSATERHIEVGDALEMFVVMNKGRTTDDLLGAELPEGMKVEELPLLGEETGMRSFLVSRPLKRD